MTVWRTVLSMATKYVRRLGIKGVCVAVLLGTLIFCDWYLYRKRTDYPPPEERCSKRYPSFSVILDHFAVFPDGTYQTDGGNVYPTYAIWNMDGIVRGCPCTMKPCLLRCCPEGQSLSGNKPTCASSEKPKSNQSHIEVSSSSKYLQKVHKPLNAYSLFGPVCFPEYFTQNANIILMEDGKFWNTATNEYVEVYDVCFDTHNENGLKGFYCYSNMLEELRSGKVSWKVWQDAFDIWLTTSVTLLLLVTLTMFAVVSKLRIGHWKTIVSYLLALTLRNSVLILYQLFPSTFDNPSKYIMELCYYVIVTPRYWQITIVYQDIKALRHGRRNDYLTRKFLYVSVFAWGLPLITMLLTFIGLFPMLLAMALECLIIESNFVVLCVKNVWSIRVWKEGTDMIQDECCPRHVRRNEWLWTFMNIALVTAVDYTMFSLFINGFKKNIFQKFLLHIYFLRGVEVFFMFVWKQSTWKAP